MKPDCGRTVVQNSAPAAARRSISASSVAAALLLAVVAVGMPSDVAAQQPSATQSAMTSYCNPGMEPIMKNTDGAIACVQPGTKALLIERGWGSEVPADAMPPADEMAMDGMGDAPADAMPPADEMAMDGMDAEAMMGAMPGGMAGSDPMMSAGDGTDMMGDMREIVPRVELTSEEEIRLSDFGGMPIRVAYDQFRMPIEFYDDITGTLGGMSEMYRWYLAMSLDTGFEPIARADLPAEGPYEAVVSGAADVILAADANYDDAGVSFTEPYMELPIVLVTTTEGRTIDVDSLSGMDVGAVSGYGGARWLEAQMPEAYTKYPTAIEAAVALRDGQIDVLVALWPVASTTSMMLEQPAIVYNSGDTGQVERLSVGYRQDDVALGTALEKALALTPAEMNAMAEQFVSTGPVDLLFGMIDEQGREAGIDLIGAAEEIEELNRASGGVEEMLLGLPEAVAFKEKYPAFDQAFYDTSYEEAELRLSTSGDETTLSIIYDKMTETATFTYMCTDSDGNSQQHRVEGAGGGMVATISGTCTAPEMS